jgi:hypothetical protein
MLKKRLAALSLAVWATGTPVMAQLRIVTMNSANSDPSTATPRDPWMQTILTAIGSSVSDDPNMAGNTGIAKPIDILALQEANNATTTSAGFAALLNSIYPGSHYQYATTTGASTGSGTQGLVYNADTVQLLTIGGADAVKVGTASTSGQPRQALRFRLRPVGYTSSADFYIYNSHYKADTGTTKPSAMMRRLRFAPTPTRWGRIQTSSILGITTYTTAMSRCTRL